MESPNRRVSALDSSPQPPPQSPPRALRSKNLERISSSTRPLSTPPPHMCAHLLNAPLAPPHRIPHRCAQAHGLSPHEAL
jgi:hypothetical protein